MLTSFKEPRTIGRAIESLTSQGLPSYELLVSAPDSETLKVARKYASRNKRIKVFQDQGKGKPAALNMLFKRAKGSILVLTDGDVLVAKGAVKSLVSHMDHESVGAVSGQVISANNTRSMFGYWAHILTRGFHAYRINEGEKVICSGYLYAIRAGLVSRMPEDILADDAYVSLSVMRSGFKSIYAPEAKVFVKYPTNLPDWIRQKKRTAGRTYQLAKYFKVSKAKSLQNELEAGMKVVREIKEPMHILWFSLLTIMRFYIWFRVFFDFRLWNRSFKRTWERVESTKN